MERSDALGEDTEIGRKRGTYMEKNGYLPVMIQSLKKKEHILTEIIRINQAQRGELENPASDPDDFDRTVEEKAKLIEELELLDSGFQELFEHVRDELDENKDAYADVIREMQEYIRRLTEKSADIQTQEARNKVLMEQKFAAVKKQVKEVRKSQKIVNQYYKNMMNTAFVDPQFTDKKK